MKRTKTIILGVITAILSIASTVAQTQTVKGVIERIAVMTPKMIVFVLFISC